MAIPIGKLTILIGAGLVGSVIVKDASISNVSGFLSGAYKVLIRHIQQDDPQPSKSRARDSLLAQVNSIRQELQLFSSSGSVTIVTDGTSGRRAYVLPVIFVGVVGWGYLWWKVTRQHLSTKINKVDNALEECNEISISTKDEVGQLREQVNEFDLRVASVAHMVENLAIPSSSHRPALELSEKALVTRAASLPPRVTETEPPSPSFSNGSPKSSAASQETPRVGNFECQQNSFDSFKSTNFAVFNNFLSFGSKEEQECEGKGYRLGLFGKKDEEWKKQWKKKYEGNELQGISNIVTSTSEPPNMTPLAEVSRGRLPHTPEAVSNDSSNASWFRWSLSGFSASSNLKKSNSDAA
ncbi:hypothetical protein QJS04_geneDACA015363 [Acorus gramineus]|uniref:DUF1664 domain-containing protein n=1 Tax=Acorus gramineus TaxID=55184 RepID=A0AAV9AR20_ACOGR|nr:hypothetical protein QJS04_geneDACA015363 [Acorus gramineus]